jgi:hypothetical protein
MRRVTFLTNAAFLMLLLLLTACAPASAQQNRRQAASVYGDVVAGPGQSEVIVENTLPAALNIFINGAIQGTVKARSAHRIVVPDGNHMIRVQSTARGAASSRELQFFTQSRRFMFRATGPNAHTVSLARESVHEISPSRAAAPTTVVPQGGSGGMPMAEPEDVPLAETALGQDRAAMFDRLDRHVGAPAPSPAAAPAPAPAAQTPVAQPSAPAPAAASAAVPAAQQTGGRPQIGVYATGDRSDSERRALATEVLTALVNSGAYTAVERSDEFLAKIDEEQIRQRGGSVDDTQISALGKQLGAHFVCIVNVAEAFGAYQISARIINVETAQVIAIGTETSQLRHIEDMRGASFRLVRALVGGSR